MFIPLFFSVYDIKKRKEAGSLHSHQGTITALAFYGQSHLFSAAADGVISLYRTKDWELLHQFASHVPHSSSSKETPKKSSRNSKDNAGKKGKRKLSVYDMNDTSLVDAVAVVSIAVHPSGKLMLSLAEDRTLRLWDLTRARAAFTTRLPLPMRPGTEVNQQIGVGQLRLMRLGYVNYLLPWVFLVLSSLFSNMLPLQVRWHPNGQIYAVLYEHALEIYSMASSATAHERFFLDSARAMRFHTVEFYDQFAICACDDGFIRIYPISKDTTLAVSNETVAGKTVPVVVNQVQDAPDTPPRNAYLSFQAHSKRVKDLTVVRSTIDDVLVTVSSDGSVRVWSLSSLLPNRPSESTSAAVVGVGSAVTLLCEKTTGSRLICVGAFVAPGFQVEETVEALSAPATEIKKATQSSGSKSKSQSKNGQRKRVKVEKK
jgi:WD40 repeat protein